MDGGWGGHNVEGCGSLAGRGGSGGWGSEMGRSGNAVDGREDGEAVVAMAEVVVVDENARAGGWGRGAHAIAFLFLCLPCNFLFRVTAGRVGRGICF